MLPAPLPFIKTAAQGKTRQLLLKSHVLKLYFHPCVHSKELLLELRVGGSFYLVLGAATMAGDSPSQSKLQTWGYSPDSLPIDPWDLQTRETSQRPIQLEWSLGQGCAMR